MSFWVDCRDCVGPPGSPRAPNYSSGCLPPESCVPPKSQKSPSEWLNPRVQMQREGCGQINKKRSEDEQEGCVWGGDSNTNNMIVALVTGVRIQHVTAFGPLP